MLSQALFGTAAAAAPVEYLAHFNVPSISMVRRNLACDVPCTKIHCLYSGSHPTGTLPMTKMPVSGRTLMFLKAPFNVTTTLSQADKSSEVSNRIVGVVPPSHFEFLRKSCGFLFKRRVRRQRFQPSGLSFGGTRSRQHRWPCRRILWKV